MVSLGVIHRGNETNALKLIHSYLCIKKNNLLESSSYSKGGGLYALGLIFANHGTAINDYLLKQLKDTHNKVNFKKFYIKIYDFIVAFLFLDCETRLLLRNWSISHGHMP